MNSLHTAHLNENNFGMGLPAQHSRSWLFQYICRASKAGLGIWQIAASFSKVPSNSKRGNYE